MKKAVNLRDFVNPLPHEHEATSFLFKKSPWAQTDHITLAAAIDSVAFQKKSISWGRYSDPVATQKSACDLARGENFPDLDWGGVLAVSGKTIAPK